MTIAGDREATSEFETALWDILDEKIAVLAPVYQPLLDGTLPRAGLAHWAAQMYFENQPFVRVLGGVLSNCEDRECQEFLVENVWEEAGAGDPTRNHVTIARRFALGCGLSDAELDAMTPDASTVEIVDYYLDLPRLPWLEALAAWGVGLEGSFLARPGRDDAVASITIADVLREQYGLSADDVEFFSMHSITDVDHTRRAMAIIRKHASTPEVQQVVIDRVREMAERVAWWAEAIMVSATKVN